MLKKELSSMLTLQALSPVHAGSGSSISAVDLPIQRERHTGWPHIQASAVKGAMRSHFRQFGPDDAKLINLIFGSDEGNDDRKEGYDLSLPGAVSVSDAKIFAFPVRSNEAPFVWVTCPAVVKRLNSDLEFMGRGNAMDDSLLSIDGQNAKKLNGYSPTAPEILLEDAVVKLQGDSISLSDEIKTFSSLERLLLISDEMFKYVVETCTEVQAHIKIDSSTGIVKEGALWYQEYLPADSVLYAVVYYSMSSKGAADSEKTVEELQAKTVKSVVQQHIKDFMQVGGDETLGKGICRIAWEGGDE